MPAQDFRSLTNLDLERNRIINAGFELFTSGLPPAPFKGQFGFSEVAGQSPDHAGVYLTTAPAGWMWFARINGPETITGFWTFNTSSGAPFSVNNNTTKVTGLNADLLDDFNSERDTFGSNSVAVRYTNGRLLVGTPEAANDAVTKAYADNLSSGNRPVNGGPVRCATVSAVVGTYSSATDAVTSSSNGAIASFAAVFDALTLVLNDRVLLKDQTSQFANGIYYVSDVGSAGTPFVLTRAPDANEAAEVTTGATVTVTLGTVNKGRKYRQSQPVANIDTDPEIWVLDSVTDLIAGPGIVIDGTKISFVDSTGYGRSSLFVSKDTATVPNTIVEQLTFVANKVLRSDATKPYWGDFPAVTLPTLEHRSLSAALTILPTGPQTQGASPLLWTYAIDPSVLVSFGTPPANTVNISAPTAGSGTTALRSNATLQLDVGIAPSWSAVHVFGAGLSTVATEKASPGFFATYEDDPSGTAQPLRWTALASVRTALKVPNPAIPANLVGITAKATGSTAQGTAYIAHDATLEIDQTISPLWKGLHTWFNADPGTHVIAIKTNESGTARFAITAGGELWWGDGGGAMDAKLSRGAAGELIQDASASTAMLSIYGLKLAAPTTTPFTHAAVWTSDPVTTRVQLQSISKANFIIGIGGVPTTQSITIDVSGGLLTRTGLATQALSGSPSWTINLLQSIAPTWTGKHIFQPTTAVPSIAVKVQSLGTAIGVNTRFLGVAADSATNAQDVVQILASDLTTFLNLGNYALAATTLTISGLGIASVSAPNQQTLAAPRTWTITVPASHPHAFGDIGGITPPVLLGRTTTGVGVAEPIAVDTTLSLSSLTLSVLSAPKWTTARSLTWTGDATGSMASVDGGGDYTTPLTVVWANSYPTLDTKYVPLTRTLTIVGAGIATAVAAPAGSDLSVNRTWTITVPATDLTGAVPITRTITHSSGGTAHLTITAAPAGADLTVNRVWTHTVIAAPKLTGSTWADGFTLPTALQLLTFQNTTASTNFPTSFGGGIRFERGATTSSYGSFQLWAELVANPAKAELWFSKLVDVGTWSPWKKFVFVGDTTTGFVPETRTLTMTATAPNLSVTNSGTAMPLSASQAWTFTVNSAPKWAAAMTLTATTELSGVATFDGSAAANFPLTIDRAINATWTGFHTFNAGITIKAATTTLSTTSQVMVTDLDASATPRDVRQVTVSALRTQLGQPTLATGAIGYGDGSNLLTGAANELGWDAANNRMFLATSVFAGALTAGYIEHDGLRPWFTPTTPLARRGVAFLDDIDFTNDASASESARIRFNSPTSGKHWAESQIPGVIGTGDYSFCIRLRWPTVGVANNTGVWCLSNHAADGAAANDMGGYIALAYPTSLILFARDSGAGFILSSAIPMTKWFGRVIDIVVTRTSGVENCYINGEQQTYTRSSQVANSLTGNPLKIRIGNMHNTVLPFPESIYRARFYNRALSLAEVLELARSGVRVSDRWGTTSPSVAGCIIDIDLGAPYLSGASSFAPDVSTRYNATVYGTYDKLPGHFHDAPSIVGQAAAVPYFGSNGRMIADAGKLAFDGTTFSVFGQAYIQAAAAIGVTVPATPVAWLELAAGTTTRAPLRLGVGVFTTALASGSIENDGVRPWYTTSTPTRRGLAFVDEVNFSNDPSSEQAGAVVFAPNDYVTARLWNGTTNTEIIGTSPCALYARIMVPTVFRGPSYDGILYISGSAANFFTNGMAMAISPTGGLQCSIGQSGTLFKRLTVNNFTTTFGGRIVDIVFTRDGTTANPSIYVDGVLQAPAYSVVGSAPEWNHSLNTIYCNAGQGFPSYGSVPRIYRAAVFNRHLTAAEVLALSLYGVDDVDMWGSQTPIHTSDFTLSVNGWQTYGGVDTAIAFNQTIDGTTGWLTATRLNTDGRCELGLTMTGYKGRSRFNVNATAFRSTTQPSFIGISNTGGSLSTNVKVALPSAVSTAVRLSTNAIANLSVTPQCRFEPGTAANTLPSVSIPVGSSYAIKGVTINLLGAILSWDFGIGCGSVVPDASGRYHGAITGSTWYHLVPSCPIGLPSGGGEVSYNLRRFVQKGVALTAATVITHNLGTKYVEVQCWQDDLAVPAKIELGVTVETDNTIKIWPTIIPVGAKATVIVVG